MQAQQHTAGFSPSRASDADARRWADSADDLRARLADRVLNRDPRVELVTPGAALAPVIAGVASSAVADSVSLEPLERPVLGGVREFETAGFIGRGLFAHGVLQRVVRGDVHTSQDDVELLNDLQAAGQAGRHHPGVPLRVLCFDSQTAFVAVDPANTRAGGYVVRSPELVQSCYALFEDIWDRSAPPHCWLPYPSDAAGLGGQVLGLLADGLKDESIARRLGLSDRTVRRVIAALQRDLGVSSRFQLALMAAEGRVLAPEYSRQP